MKRLFVIAAAVALLWWLSTLGKVGMLLFALLTVPTVGLAGGVLRGLVFGGVAAMRRTAPPVRSASADPIAAEQELAVQAQVDAEREQHTAAHAHALALSRQQEADEEQQWFAASEAAHAHMLGNVDDAAFVCESNRIADELSAEFASR